MKEHVITIDTGTTNTRCILWDAQRQPVSIQKREVGVRNTAVDGNNSALKAAVRECLQGLLNEGGIEYDDVRLVLASGMITSNVGLLEVPHLVAPAGMEELAKAIHAEVLEDICPLPIHFVPGIKNNVNPVSYESLEAMDIMRGEEVEACAVLDELHDGNPMVLVLPGSHTKFVAVDANRKITGCLTSIAGELLSCITHNTIIADAVARRFAGEDYDKEALLLGYDEASRVGLARTCFSARIMNQFITKDANTVASFVLGATLQGDIEAIKNSSAVRADKHTTIVVSGKDSLRKALMDILEHDGSFGRLAEYEPKENRPLSALGCYRIAEVGGIL